MVYLGSMTNFDGTYNWIQDKCVPLVREITFENGEVWLSSVCCYFKLRFPKEQAASTHLTVLTHNSLAQ